MKHLQQRGRPMKKAKDRKTKAILVRLMDLEKEGFRVAADLAGISLSAWVRERLRSAAIRELEQAGKRVPFIPDIPIGGNDV